MSELLVTQCPHCQTRFRLTPEQLSVAAGHVRCGACLEVFHAADAAVALTPAPKVEEPAPEPDTPVESEPAPQTQDSLLHDDLDEPDLAALGLDESIIGEVNPDSIPAPNDVEPEPASSNELTDLHEDFLSTPPAQDFGPDFDHQRVGMYKLLPEEEGYTDKGIFQRDHPVAPTADQSALTDDEQADEQPQQVLPEPPAEPPVETLPTPTITEEENATSETSLHETEDDHPDPHITPLGLEMLEDELLTAAPTQRRPRTWLWTCLALVALLALPAQYLYYNFDGLARDQRTRPLLEDICLLARCELPARVDISRIRSTNLLVRPHPEFPNALAIDAILYNRADFEQPFPVLEMQFEDASGRQLVNRRFRPEEYLSGELAGVNLMPPQTPIRVGLSMLDPGPQVRSYRLEFLSP